MNYFAPSTPPPNLRRFTAPENARIMKKSPNNRSNDLKANRNIKPWSSDDERTLLQGRLERIPYKQIGAKLGKSDLACRLHFHQMIMAKRTPETQQGGSIVFLATDHLPVNRLAPAPSFLNKEATYDEPCLSSGAPTSTFRQDPSTTNQLRGSDQSKAKLQSTLVPGWQPTASPYATGERQKQGSPAIDLDRLHNIYKEHAGNFWSTIAAKYSGLAHLSPSELESAFFNARISDGGYFESAERNETTDATWESRELLTSMTQPRHVRSSSSLSVAGKCSVESLLNHAEV